VPDKFNKLSLANFQIMKSMRRCHVFLYILWTGVVVRILLAFLHDFEADKIAESLHRRGYEFDIVSSTYEQSAITSLDAATVVVIDMRANPVRGLDFVHRIRSVRQDVGLIVLTRPHASDDVVEALTAGADLHLDRDIAPNIVAAMVASLGRRINKMVDAFPELATQVSDLPKPSLPSN
jgi:DNA-binding response OmpR family regulator